MTGFKVKTMKLTREIECQRNILGIFVLERLYGAYAREIRAWESGNREPRLAVRRKVVQTRKHIYDLLRENKLNPEQRRLARRYLLKIHRERVKAAQEFVDIAR